MKNNLLNLKKVFILFSFLFSLTSVLAQAPEKMSYQAVVRNTSNNLVTSQAVGMKISILQGSVSGTAVYAETQTPTSNTNGLVTLEIGGGTVVSGTFATINWANGPFFIKTETDPTGGTSYTITGISQLLSSPYALYAKTSGSSTPGPQGPQGIAGTNGNDGPAGPQGIQGLTGAQGIQGEVGPQGLTGATGPQGIAGTNGNDGAVGTTGPQGIQGEVGSQGPIGLTGATGPQGIAGTNGTNGQGVPTGGTANQVLAKVDGTDYNTTWVTPASGSADNLGNHTATQALNMSNNNITNANNTTTNRVTFQEMVNPTILNYSSTLTTVSSAQLDATGYSYIKISGVALGTPATITGLAGGVQGKIVNLMIDSPYTLTFNSPSEQVGSKLFNTWSSTNAGQNLPYNGTRYIVTLMFDNNIWQVINYML